MVPVWCPSLVSIPSPAIVYNAPFALASKDRVVLLWLRESKRSPVEPAHPSGAQCRVGSALRPIPHPPCQWQNASIAHLPQLGLDPLEEYRVGSDGDRGGAHGQRRNGRIE